jgi:hypothetical protein
MNPDPNPYKNPYDQKDDPLSMQDCIYLGRHLTDAALAYIDALKARDFEYGCGPSSDEELFEEMLEFLRTTA